MRARLIVVAAAVTSMVAIAFLVPLAILTRDLAADRERVAAENDAETIARILVTVPPESIRTALDAGGDAYRITDRDVSIVFEDGTVLGEPLDPDENLTAAFQGASPTTTPAGPTRGRWGGKPLPTVKPPTTSVMKRRWSRPFQTITCCFQGVAA